MNRADFLDFTEARSAARRSLPRGIFDYIDRGSEAETGIGYNRTRLDAMRLVPRVLQGQSVTDLRRTVLGRVWTLPFAPAPTAFAGLVRDLGDIALARASHAAGLPFCAATESVVAVEEIARATQGELWFQLYKWEGQANWQGLLRRAAECGIKTLVLTVDTPVYPKRIHNIRNGFGLPLRFGARNVADVLRHPAWAMDVLGGSLKRGGMPRFANYPPESRQGLTGRSGPLIRHQPKLSWEDVAQVRDYWRGDLLIKGILSRDDAALARDHGAQGIVVSSHGMRNLDCTVAPIDVLPGIRAEVGATMAILADSGVQRGSDIIKLLHAGADLVLCGRAMLYALAAGGEAGVARMIAILREELDQTLSQSGSLPPNSPASLISART